jgi:hypothetical protein
MELSQTEETKNLKKAWFQAKAELKTSIEPDSNNPHFKSKFINLDQLLKKINPVLQKHKLGIMQWPTGTGLITSLFHEPTGEEITSYYELLLEKKNAQGVGSALTYAKRQIIQSMFSMSAGAEEDDDGEASLEDSLDDRIKKMVDAFAGVGISQEDLEDRIKHPIKYITTKEFEDLGKYFKEVKDPQSTNKLNDKFGKTAVDDQADINSIKKK